MEMKLVDGDYVPDNWGGFETVTGEEELLQRILFKLQCRRGGFAPLNNLGSRLYLLHREKTKELVTAARRYILEALAEETEVELTGVEVMRYEGGIIRVSAVFRYGSNDRTITVAV